MKRVFCSALGSLVALAAASPLEAADLGKPSIPQVYGFGWSGWYVGGHFGDAFDAPSGWTAASAGSAAAGQFNLASSYDSFKGSGSAFGGLQGGYNVLLPSRVLWGFEVDVSFPNSIAGTAPAAIGGGIATYDDMVKMFGTARGRLGYVLDNNWLLYGTGGFAWSYDRIKRTQISGGVLPADTEQEAFLWRLGWTVGTGLEVPFAPHWSARLEYLYSEFGQSTKFIGADVFRSDLSSHQVRAGLNYNLSDPLLISGSGLATKAPVWPTETNWAIHGQSTLVEQYAAPFKAPYSGPNSLARNVARETWDATAYVGVRLWEGAEAWFNPEIDQGFGLSNTLGVAGFVSGEAYKQGATYPYTRIQRAFVRQTINLGGETQKIDEGLNQFAGSQSANRIVVTVGKIGVGDIFDTNKYAHDPRVDFFNWSLIDAGTFDYAADAWGYTLGASAEWYQGNWTVRGGVFDLPTVPNSTQLDPDFSQFQWIGEIEHRHTLWGQPGKIAVTSFLSRARMGRFADATQLALVTGTPADIAAVRQYRSRSGVSLNLEQQIVPDVGFFARAGWADGSVEPYAFTDIDRTVSAGISVNGNKWGRPDDTFGLAGAANFITKEHQAFLNAGGLGILVGDGQLPHPGAEHVLETYYSLPLSYFKVTLDYQLVVNPAYNRDRGPVSVFATRLHTQF
ncbi:MAG: carbohydrate porin [Xanthobacteraceae bacterium]|nr:carbohydrate porin [Xanthobacteraceae bacterium]